MAEFVIDVTEDYKVINAGGLAFSATWEGNGEARVTRSISTDPNPNDPATVLGDHGRPVRSDGVVQDEIAGETYFIKSSTAGRLVGWYV